MAFWLLLPWCFSSRRSLESTFLPNDCVIYYTNTLADTILALFLLFNYICDIFFWQLCIIVWTQTYLLHQLCQYTLIPVVDFVVDWIHRKPQNSLMLCSQKSYCISSSSDCVLFTTYNTAALILKTDVKWSLLLMIDCLVDICFTSVISDANVKKHIYIFLINARGLTGFTQLTQYSGEYTDRIFSFKLTLLFPHTTHS